MKNRYEELLPKDPIGALDKIKENYRRYFETMYKFREQSDDDADEELYKDINQRKNDLWKDDNGVPKDVYNDPYLEILPEYESTGKKLTDILSEDPYKEDLSNLCSNYTEFINAGLMKYPPYKHQVEMLRKAFGNIGNCHNVVITSGTGSGKTESFLLPLFASLLAEAGKWGKQNYNQDWFAPDGDNYAPQQREGENRPAAIRSLIMYPMNALVEDQVARLREALDSDEVRKVLNTKFNGNRIFFGRYTSATLGSKAYHPSNLTKQAEVKEELRKLADRAEAILHKSPKNTTISPRIYRTNSGNQSGICAEMVTRWDMQVYPPDILITNVAMLNIMLMREAERGMLDITRKWFTAADKNTKEEKEQAKKERIFHLVIDELHLYRGTSGTEVSYLLKMFLDRIGVPPTITAVDGTQVPNPQLRILASSASLGDSEESTIDYLEQFFGVYYENKSNGNKSFLVQEGNPYRVNDERVKVDYPSFKNYIIKNSEGQLRFIVDEDSCEQIRNDFLAKNNCNTIDDYMQCKANQIFYDIQNICTRVDDGNTRTVPVRLEVLCDKLFEGDKDALRGFLLFRADPEVVKCCDNYRLPRIRFHQFFKYIEGLWGELLPTTHHEGKDSQPTIGKLMLQPKEYEEESSRKVLEILRCECCGELFIGGNRKFNGTDTDRTKFMLSLNSPELTRVPNRNPTPMVQDKLYVNYGIFWPTLRQPSNKTNFFTEKFNTTDNKKNTGYNETKSMGHWEKAYLNPYDGTVCLDSGINVSQQVQGWIKGYIYVIYDNDHPGTWSKKEDNQMALPCLCPHCNADYHRRRYVKSPIRSFRSGFKRSNQILSKELLYQLPCDDRKLIGFSDSRQDAAEQSYGIAQEHYRDMVRLAFLQSLDEKGSNAGTTLSNVKTILITMGIDQNNDFGQIQTLNAFPDLQKQVQDIFYNASLSNNEKKAQISAITVNDSLIKLDDFVGANLDGMVVKKLLQVQTNPAGIDYKNQTYWNDYDKSNHFWSDTFDMVNCKAKSGTDINYSSALNKESLVNLKKVLFQICVGRYMGITTEDAGIGYLSLTDNDIKHSSSYVNFSNCCTIAGLEPLEVINAYIRILGDNNRYESNDIDDYGTQRHPWTNYNDFGRLKNQLDLLISKNPETTSNWGNNLFNILADSFQTGADLRLNFANLYFQKADPKSTFWKCPKCGRIHLHKGLGICTNTACCEPLVTSGTETVGDIQKKHYIAYDTKVEVRDACRIHTEELTGQTDNQAERLLEFKGIILDDRPAKEIDMVNVTTTMEVGIDIGSLLAVYQGNMPPTRYNYQQRVGRGGRRGQAFSTAITFCRGKSHDSYYYDQGADEMTGGLPALPKLSVKPQNNVFNDAIVRRVIAKHVLRQAYLDKRLCQDPSENSENDSTNLELGLWENWSTSIRPVVDDWIKKNSIEVERIVNLYLLQYSSLLTNNPIHEMTTWVKEDLLNDIDTVGSHRQYDSIAQDLVENGRLPIYGLPTSQRVLYHGKNKDGYRTIDRPLEQAISEFSPGSIKIKDHGKYIADGLTVNFMNKAYPSDADFCSNPNLWNALEFSYNIKYNNGEVESISDDFDKDAINTTNNFRIVIPKAFRTLIIAGNKGDIDDNDDNSHFASTQIWVDDTKSIQAPSYTSNVKLNYWNSANSDKPIIWYINDNNGQRYPLIPQYALDARNMAIEPKFFRGSHENYNKTIKLVDYAPNAMTNTLPGAIPNTAEDMVLGAKKTTELIKLQVANAPFNIQIKMVDNAGHDIDDIIKAAIKAAYYSAATLIVRCFADEQDIQPDEIQISEVQIDNNGFPYIYLSDSLANGSGYMKMLNDVDENGEPHIINVMKRIVSDNETLRGTFINSIMSKQHMHDCKSSCAKCLRTYQNQGYHHVLDWRLGMDLIKLMLDSNYDMGQNIAAPYGDLGDIIDEVGLKVENANSSRGIKYDKVNKCLKTMDNFANPLSQTAEDKYEMIVHPLWVHDAKKDQNVFQLIRGIYTPKDGHRTPQSMSSLFNAMQREQIITTTGRNLLDF